MINNSIKLNLPDFDFEKPALKTGFTTFTNQHEFNKNEDLYNV